jgi:hypothetical protein
LHPLAAGLRIGLSMTPRHCPPLLPLLLPLALAFALGNATAHDTWFEPLPSARAGEARLALGTGNRFPRQEFGVGEASLQQQGCVTRDGAATRLALDAVRDTGRALLMRVRRPHPGSALSCWAQQQPFELELGPDKVAVYFDEIRPNDAVRAAWAEMQSRGVGWKERYSKHARIELTGRSASAVPPQPAGMGLEILLDGTNAAPRAGDTLGFRVLRDGEPLPDLAVELRNDLSPLGFWGRTDAQGRVSLRVPLAGGWLLRGTDLRLSPAEPDAWESRFVTLAFSVAPSP